MVLAVGVVQADDAVDAAGIGSKVAGGTVGTRVVMVSTVVDETAGTGRFPEAAAVHAVVVGRALGNNVSSAMSTGI